MADGKVTIGTELDSSGAEKGASKLGGKLKSGLGTAAKVGAGAVAAVGTAAVATGKKMLDLSKDTAQFGDNIDKQSQKMGISSTAYQEWDFVMQHCGMSINSLKGGMKTLSRAVEQPSKNGQEAFKKLGISVDDLKNKSQEEIFSKVVTGLQGMKEGTERTAIATTLLGRAGSEMGALLNTSAEDTAKMKKQVHDLGGVMSEEAVKASAKYQDSLQDMQTALDGAKRKIGAEFLPAITDVMDGITMLFSGKDGTKKIEKGINSIATGITKALPKISKVATSILGTIGGVILDNLPMLIDVGVNIILKLVDGIIQAFPKLVDAFILIVEKVVQKLPEILPKLVKAFIDVVKTISKEIPKILPQIVDAILEITDLLVDQSDELIDAGFELIDALVEGLMKATPKLLEKMPDIIVKMAEKTAENADKIADKADVIMEKLADGLVKATPKLIKSAPKIMLALAKAMTASLGAFYKLAFVILKNLWNGLKDNFTQFKDWASTMIPKIKDAFISAMGTIKDVGKNLVEGIWNGISGAGGWLKEKITGFGKGVVNKFKDVFDIHSPSKLFEKIIGRNLALGIAVGFEKYNPMSQINNDLKNGISKINATATADLSTSVSSNAMNYMAMADVFVSALEKSGLTVSIGERQFGRIVRSVI